MKRSGLNAACAVGVLLTQGALDSFHFSGMNVSTGPTRILEILNNSATPRTSSFTVEKSYEECKRLKIFCLNQVYLDFEIVDSPPVWIDTWEGLYGSIPNKEAYQNLSILLRTNPFDIQLLGDCLMLKTLACDINKWEFWMSWDMDQIMGWLAEAPPNVDQKRWVTIQRILPAIKNLRLCGLVEGITEVVEYGPRSCILFGDTNLASVVHIDPVNIVTNKINQVVDIFGIEVAKRMIFEELVGLMPTIDPTHLELISAIMTFDGKISSVTRYSIRLCSDVFKRCTFEESLRNIVVACKNGEVDTIKTVASQIMTSQIGTMI